MSTVREGSSAFQDERGGTEDSLIGPRDIRSYGMTAIEIDVIDRGVFQSDLNYMVEGGTMATLDEQNPDVQFIDNAVYNLVISHPEGTILWDTGIHHDAAGEHWPDWLFQAFPMEDASEHRLDDDLERAGWGLEEIDYVFQTHLHCDHAGGLEFFDGTDIPIFVHAEELKWAYYSVVSAEGGAGYLLNDIHWDLNWEVIHRNRVEVFEDIEFILLDGHTPGVLGTIVHLPDGETVIFTSDQFYRRENYEEGAPLGAGLLWNKQRWLDNLRYVEDLERRHDATLVFGHETDQVAQIRDGWP